MILNQAQREVLNVMSCLNSEQDVAELKRVLIAFLNERLQKELDAMWDDGTLNQEKLNAYRNEHLRTPYR